jgi:hypothetical protein
MRHQMLTQREEKEVMVATCMHLDEVAVVVESDQFGSGG